MNRKRFLEPPFCPFADRFAAAMLQGLQQEVSAYPPRLQQASRESGFQVASLRVESRGTTVAALVCGWAHRDSQSLLVRAKWHCAAVLAADDLAGMAKTGNSAQ